jgi:hypothetical protein
MASVSILTTGVKATLMEDHATTEFGPLAKSFGKNVARHALLSKK